MQFITILKLIISLMPLVIDAVKIAEKAFPIAGTGKEKLATVQATLEASYQISSDAAISFNKVWPALKNTIAAIVAGFNAAGIFK